MRNEKKTTKLNWWVDPRFLVAINVVSHMFFSTLKNTKKMVPRFFHPRQYGSNQWVYHHSNDPPSFLRSTNRWTKTFRGLSTTKKMREWKSKKDRSRYPFFLLPRSLVGGWTNPFEKYYYVVTMGILPNFPGENNKYLKPAPRNIPKHA